MSRFRIFFISIVLSQACLMFSSAEIATLPADYSGPVRVDLSGTWNFRLDASNEGERLRWFEERSADQWAKIVVPGSFNEQLAKDASRPEIGDAMRFFKGVAWYRTHFASPASKPNSQVILHLSGTVLRHTVWLNGKLMGRSARPYLDETYDVSQWLNKGASNLLVIMVDNTIQRAGIPDEHWHGWWDDGGLIRPVYLELRAQVSAQSYVTTGMETTGWRLHIETVFSVSAKAKGNSIKYTLYDTAGKVIWHLHTSAVPGNLEKNQFTISRVLRGIDPWSPEHPTLYSLTTSIGKGAATDTTTVRIGFRQIAVQGTQIMLNGQPYAVRGVSRHQFLASAGMSPTTIQDRNDIKDIKALGANIVRLAHYSQSQDVYDACDELGLLVWTEIPAWQSRVESLSDAVVWRTEAQPQLLGMVMQHRNHASVVIWSVANEIPSQTEDGAAYVAKAVAYVKSLDTSRLVTFASDRRLTDKAFDAVDVIAINEYYGWYYGKTSDVGPMLDEMHAQFPKKPLLVSEFGADAVAGWDPATAPPGTRDYSYMSQVDFLKTHLEQIFAPERKGYVAGALIWLYNDFPDPSRIGGDHPLAANFRNNKGLVTMDRVHKPAYDSVQSFFHQLQASKTSP